MVPVSEMFEKLSQQLLTYSRKPKLVTSASGIKYRAVIG